MLQIVILKFNFHPCVLLNLSSVNGGFGPKYTMGVLGNFTSFLLMDNIYFSTILICEILCVLAL